MKKAAEKIIRDGVAAGKFAEDLRSELISNGLSSEGFDETYKAIVAELGVEEHHAPVHEGSVHVGVELDPDRPHDMADVIKRKEQVDRTRSRNNIVGLLFFTLVVAALIFAYITSGAVLQEKLGALFGADNQEEMNPADAARAVQVERYQIAAEAYKSRVFDYNGVCESVGLDQEQFDCFENTVRFAIDTRLSTGKYYCADSSGFRGILKRARNGDEVCR